MDKECKLCGADKWDCELVEYMEYPGGGRSITFEYQGVPGKFKKTGYLCKSCLVMAAKFVKDKCPV